MRYIKKLSTDAECEKYMNVYSELVCLSEETKKIYYHQEDIELPLYIDSIVDNNEVSFSYKEWEYSFDNIEWNIANSSSKITIGAGTRLFIRVNNLNTTSVIGKISTTGLFDVGGNTMSLLYGSNFANQTSLQSRNYIFRGLFQGAKVKNAKRLKLPAIYTTKYCYQDMFSGCSSLVTAPELPATSLSTRCYQNMFSGCTSLVKAPELPARRLYGEAPYQGMFYGCVNLKYIKAMFIDTPGSAWTSNWVNGVSPTGTFVKNTEAFWELSGVNGIPEGWNIEYDGILVNDADIYIQHIDNTLYTTEEWVTNGFSNEDANGVAVVAEEAKFVVAKTSPSGSVYWSSDTGTLLEDICTASNSEVAKADLLGQHNTQVMFATDTHGASYVCANYAFPNGEKGYLPALGELFVAYRNKYNINNALNLIGGSIGAVKYWSSTQCTATIAWYIDWEEGDIFTKYKADNARVIPFLPLNI